MTTKLALTILALAFTSGPTPPDRPSGIECAGQGDSLAPENIRKKLRGVVGGLARLGLAEEVAFLRERLVELGDTPSDHTQLERAWNRDLGRAKPEKNDCARKALTKNVTMQVTALGKHLERGGSASRRPRTPRPLPGDRGRSRRVERERRSRSVPAGGRAGYLAVHDGRLRSDAVNTRDRRTR